MSEQSFIMSFFLTEASVIKRMKAPKGKQYIILSFAPSISESGDNEVVVVSRNVRGRTTLDQDDRAALYIVSARITGRTDSWTLRKGVKTKWLTIGRSGSGTFEMNLHIEYDLIPLSKRDALMEWFMKG